MLAMNQRPFLRPCLSVSALLVMLLGASASAAEILSPGRLRERICESPWEFSRLRDDAELARAKAYLGRAKAAGFAFGVPSLEEFARKTWEGDTAASSGDRPVPR